MDLSPSVCWGGGGGGYSLRRRALCVCCDVFACWGWELRRCVWRDMSVCLRVFAFEHPSGPVSLSVCSPTLRFVVIVFSSVSLSLFFLSLFFFSFFFFSFFFSFFLVELCCFVLVIVVCFFLDDFSCFLYLYPVAEC